MGISLKERQITEVLDAKCVYETGKERPTDGLIIQ
jgi:hypothetical protein